MWDYETAAIGTLLMMLMTAVGLVVTYVISVYVVWPLLKKKFLKGVTK